MDDKKWRQDTSEYMTDDEYQTYLDKKRSYAQKNQLDSSISKLAESYKNRIPGSTDPTQLMRDDMPLPLESRKVESAQDSIRQATGYAEGGEVDFEDSLRDLKKQGYKIKDLRRDIDVDEDEIQPPNPKFEALKKFLRK